MQLQPGPRNYLAEGKVNARQKTFSVMFVLAISLLHTEMSMTRSDIDNNSQSVPLKSIKKYILSCGCDVCVENNWQLLTLFVECCFGKVNFLQYNTTLILL